MSEFIIRDTGYKRTTDKQYSILTQEMARLTLQNHTGKKADPILHWNNLTEKLNELGPPYRTVQQWKKVWTDFRRFHSKRGFKSKPKFTKTIKNERKQYNEIFPTELEEQQEAPQTENKGATSTKVAQFLRTEWEEFEHNSRSMYSTNTNEYADEYSYPDRHSSQQSDTELHETLIPDNPPYDSYSYANHEVPRSRTSINLPSIANHGSLPPLRPANTPLLDQTLYTLQNQMENQTKLLEHLSQISSTMASLMERQVNAVEKQTEALRRQASATEHHTLVMNNFVDMLREKMPKAKKSTTSTPNLSNGSL